MATHRSSWPADALGNLSGYDLLQVQEGTSWLAAKGKRGEATPYPVDRGTVLPLSKFSFCSGPKAMCGEQQSETRAFTRKPKTCLTHSSSPSTQVIQTCW